MSSCKCGGGFTTYLDNQVSIDFWALLARTLFIPVKTLMIYLTLSPSSFACFLFFFIWPSYFTHPFVQLLFFKPTWFILTPLSFTMMFVTITNNSLCLMDVGPTSCILCFELVFDFYKTKEILFASNDVIRNAIMRRSFYNQSVTWQPT